MASFVGAFLYLTPAALAAVVLVFAVIVGVSRFVSLGSIIGALVFPLACWLILQPSTPVMLAAILGGAFIIWRHKSNIERLRAGTENAFTFSKKK